MKRFALFGIQQKSPTTQPAAVTTSGFSRHGDPLGRVHPARLGGGLNEAKPS